jgi:hypothetical protein
MKAITLAALCTTLGVGVATAQRAPGAEYEYGWEVAVSEPGGDARGTVRVRGDDVRVDVEPRERLNLDYLLVRDRGRTLTAVRADRREYETTDAALFPRVAGAALRLTAPVVTVRLSDTAVVVERLGSGGRVEGRETERVRITVRYTVRVGVFGFGGTPERHEVVTEHWVDPTLALAPNPAAELMADIDLAFAQANPRFWERVEDARARALRGAPLRTVVRATVHSQGEAPRSIQRTVTIRDVRARPQPADRFRLPANYRPTGS